MTTHGMSKTREYRLWKGMRNRCNNPRCPCFDQYGGRGITVCDRWQKSFSSFFLDMGFAPSEEHTLERIDNNGNYTPGNVKWATRKEQANNKANNTFLEYNGQRQTISEWSQITGIGRTAIRERAKSGLPMEKVLSKNYRMKHRTNRHKSIVYLSFNGERRSVPEWSQITGIHKDTIHYRLRNKWPIKDILTVPPNTRHIQQSSKVIKITCGNNVYTFKQLMVMTGRPHRTLYQWYRKGCLCEKLSTLI